MCLLPSTSASTAALLADGNLAVRYTSTHLTGYQIFTINSTGDYNLLVGSSDAGDIRQRSTLVLNSATISVTDHDFDVTQKGIRLDDGTVPGRDGSEVLPSGLTLPNTLAAGGQAVINYLISQGPGSSARTGRS